jgi:hypothetical protein
MNGNEFQFLQMRKMKLKRAKWHLQNNTIDFKTCLFFFLRMKKRVKAWWYILVIAALWRLRQGDLEF